MGFFPTLWTRGQTVSLTKKRESDDPATRFLCFAGLESNYLRHLYRKKCPFVKDDSQKGKAQSGRLWLTGGVRKVSSAMNKRFQEQWPGCKGPFYNY